MLKKLNFGGLWQEENGGVISTNAGIDFSNYNDIYTFYIMPYL